MKPREFILHIGPPKTASTTIQYALRSRRGALEESGTELIPCHEEAVHDLFETNYLDPHARVQRGAWRNLIKSVHASDSPRIIMSNELLSFADSRTIERIIQPFKDYQVSVIFCVRPISRLLTSYWQEQVKAGSSQAIAPWLARVFTQDASDDLRRPESRFVRAERHDLLAARWADVVGNERVTAIILKESDPSFTLRAFAHVAGLSPAVFDGINSVHNRSLTHWESLALQRLNAALSIHADGAAVARSVSAAVVKQYQLRMRDSGMDPRIHLTPEDLDRASLLQEKISAGLQASGIQIYGEIAELHNTVDTNVTDAETVPNAEVLANVSVDVALGSLAAAGVIQPTISPRSGRRQRRPLIPIGTMVISLIRTLSHRIQMRAQNVYRRR